MKLELYSEVEAIFGSGLWGRRLKGALPGPAPSPLPHPQASAGRGTGPDALISCKGLYMNTNGMQRTTNKHKDLLS